MKGIVITTDNKVEVQTFEEPLYQTIGKAVGGYIEVVHPKGLPEPFVMIVNEEGLLQQLPTNLIGCLLYATDQHGIPIVGNIVLMKEGWTDEGPDIVGLDPEEITSFFEAMRELKILKGVHKNGNSETR